MKGGPYLKMHYEIHDNFQLCGIGEIKKGGHDNWLFD